jgi:hypothetical protein
MTDFPGVVARIDSEQRNEDTVPRGRYVIDPEPWGPPYVVQDDQEDPKPAQSRGPAVCREEGFVISAGSRQTVLLHPADAAGLQPLANWENCNGCCGPTGDEGLNRACPCGAPVAPLVADCFGPYELHGACRVGRCCEGGGRACSGRPKLLSAVRPPAGRPPAPSDPAD